jgi:hypothetical protein
VNVARKLIKMIIKRKIRRVAKHSLKVANEVAVDLAIDGRDHCMCQAVDFMTAIVATVCVAHNLSNKESSEVLALVMKELNLRAPDRRCC